MLCARQPVLVIYLRKRFGRIQIQTSIGNGRVIHNQKVLKTSMLIHLIQVPKHIKHFQTVMIIICQRIRNLAKNIPNHHFFQMEVMNLSKC